MLVDLAREAPFDHDARVAQTGRRDAETETETDRKTEAETDCETETEAETEIAATALY